MESNKHISEIPAHRKAYRTITLKEAKNLLGDASNMTAVVYPHGKQIIDVCMRKSEVEYWNKMGRVEKRAFVQNYLSEISRRKMEYVLVVADKWDYLEYKKSRMSLWKRILCWIGVDKTLNTEPTIEQVTSCNHLHNIPFLVRKVYLSPLD